MINLQMLEPSKKEAVPNETSDFLAGRKIDLGKNIEETKQETINLTSDEQKDDFIHFQCICGKHLKVIVEYAGKIGKCPKCQKRLRVPDKKAGN